MGDNNSYIYFAWKGEGDDPRMFYSWTLDGQHWTGQTQVGGGTSDSPALVNFNGTLYLAWKGEGDDPRMFYSSSADGQTWTDQIQVGGGTSNGPTLTTFNGCIYLAWKGEGGDPRMFYSWSVDGVHWVGQTPVGGATSDSPTLTTFDGRLYLAWKGEGEDPRIFYSSSADGEIWTDQTQVGGGTSDGPALGILTSGALFDVGRLYLAWKGEGDDPRMFYCSSADGQTWTDQTQVGGGTSDSPALAIFNGRLYLAWKGEGDDPRMFYSWTLDGQHWTGQTQVGVATSNSPALVWGPGLFLQMQYQQMTEWCWVAVTTSISLFYNPSSPWTQCSLITALLQSNPPLHMAGSCCPGPKELEANPALAAALENPYLQSSLFALQSLYLTLDATPTGICNHTGGWDGALAYVGNLNTNIGNKVSINDLLDQTSAGHPVCVGIQWAGGGQHVVAVSGVDVIANMVTVLDPANGPWIGPYDTLATAYNGDGTWFDTCYTQP